MMRKLLFALGFLFSLSALHASNGDTVERSIVYRRKIIQTEEFVVRSVIDSGVKMESYFYIDTLVSIDTHIITVPRSASPWKWGSEFGLSTGQTAFFHWAAGGTNSYSFIVENKSYAHYNYANSSWFNDLKIAYGLQQQGDNPWYKNNDQIELKSIYGFRASPRWNYSALLNFKSQFSKGYSTATSTDYISRFLSPAYLTLSLGMEYKTHNENFSIYLSPLAFELTYINDTSLGNRFSIPRGENHLSSLGPTGRFEYKGKPFKSLELETKLVLFADILKMNEPFLKIEWFAGVRFRINRFMQLVVETGLIYDPKVMIKIKEGENTVEKRRVQFKESVRLNFVYRLGGDRS